jgi:hypothetical protein
LSKCKICREVFTKTSSTQICCSYPCALKYAGTQREKKEAREAKVERSKTKQRKEALKSLTELANEAQIPFNKFIRLRDQGKPCISCQRSLLLKVNAGHYRTRGAANHLRFNEDNCHLQCEHCNSFLSGNIINYRPNLIKKIGLEAVEALENDNRTHKYTREELIEIKKEYQNKCKIIENNYK